MDGLIRDWQNYTMRYRLFRPALALGVCLATLPMAHQASASPSDTVPSATVEGQRLEIGLACPAILHIRTEKGPKNTVRGHWPDNTAITHQPDGTVRLAIEACATPDATATKTPTSIDIATPPNMALAIEAPQASTVVVDNRSGPVFLHTGPGLTQIGTAETLDLIADAAGTIDIPTLPDSARIRSTGTASITIGKANGTALSVYLGGASSFLARSGRLKALEITSASTKDAIFHGETGVAALHVESSGSIIVDKASGTVATERDGPGRILVNQPPDQPTTSLDHPSGEPAGHQPTQH
ncbi:MAG: hypothetical protein ABF785_04135 [Acetobacter papayae]|uniref:hypothetical protein n=1 Tax=Acetobacter papayae TaxID=1076592 RepID=UPI0039EA4085